MLSSTRLKEIVSEARPYIEQQMDAADMIAGFRDVVAADGGDWSALKALIKAQIKDERDETGAGKHVQKILDKAEFSAGYAGMLGWSNMNEQNFSAETGEITDTPETADDLPAQESGGTVTGGLAAHPHGKSNAARPASVDAQPNDRGLVGQASESVVTGRRDGQTNHEATVSDGLHDDRLQRVPDTLSDKPGNGGEAGGSLSAAPLSFADKIARLRPGCQRPSACRSSGGNQICFICRKPQEQAGAA